ncbi:hypothetical protein Q5705_09610 [Kosakonia sp. H02]|nr:hypothetical protein Q5705_09610 [Kosakonia sp. H02]
MSAKGPGEGGFTYLWVLLMLTVLSLSLLKDTRSRQVNDRQQQEEELFFRGVQIRNAIQSYQKSGSGCFPLSFDDLLRDTRDKKVVGHLRLWFADPLTGSRQWGMAYDKQGRWIGVFSKGKGKPLRHDLFPHEIKAFKNVDRYEQWVFKTVEVPSAPLPSACRSLLNQPSAKK